jgi:hypothetical protein
MDAYVGGAYELAFGEGYISYEETAGNWWTNLWDQFMNTGSGWWYYEDAQNWYDGSAVASDNADVSTVNIWDDSTWAFNVIDYLPTNV